MSDTFSFNKMQPKALLAPLHEILVVFVFVLVLFRKTHKRDLRFFGLVFFISRQFPDSWLWLTVAGLVKFTPRYSQLCRSSTPQVLTNLKGNGGLNWNPHLADRGCSTRLKNIESQKRANKKDAFVPYQNYEISAIKTVHKHIQMWLQTCSCKFIYW